MIIKIYKILVFAILLLNAGSLSAAGPKKTKGFWQDYKIIAQRNIFSRSRRSFVEKRSDGPKRISRPESYLILRGIVRQGNEYIAFLENTSIGKTIKAKLGDSVAKGKLKSLTLDHIEYESDDNVTKVKVGNTLLGNPFDYTTPVILHLSLRIHPKQQVVTYNYLKNKAIS
jgi:hypothetical protein